MTNKSSTPSTTPESSTEAQTAAPAAPQKAYSADPQTFQTYANLTRITGLPDELVVEFMFDTDIFAQKVDVPGRVSAQVLLNYPAAKRMLLVLADTIRRYEEKFGPIELDILKRIKAPEELS